jgi:hypothetical protein
MFSIEIGRMNEVCPGYFVPRDGAGGPLLPASARAFLIPDATNHDDVINLPALKMNPPGIRPA